MKSWTRREQANGAVASSGWAILHSVEFINKVDVDARSCRMALVFRPCGPVANDEDDCDLQRKKEGKSMT